MKNDANTFICPACGESNHCDAEVLKEEGQTVRDCWVCCRPLVLHYDGERIIADLESE